MGRCATLHPDRLPDPGQQSIPGLLAMRDLGKNLKWVIHADSQGIYTRTRSGGNIQVKGKISAFMLSHFDVVDPDLGKIIHCAETKDNDTILFKPAIRKLKFALIPGGTRMVAKTRIRLPG